MPKARITVIIGTGASIAARAPSVRDITEAVLAMQSPRIRGDMREYYIQNGSDPPTPAGAVLGIQPSEPAVRQIDRALRSIRRTYNFETILHAVETLEPYVASRTLLQDLADVRPILTAFTDPTPRYDPLMNWVLLWRTRWEIIRVVRDLVITGSARADARYLESTASFIEKVGDAFVIDAFNLNYDDLFERTHGWSDGFAPVAAGWSGFDRASYVNAFHDDAHTMTHLHGSVRFGYRAEDTSAVKGGPPQRQVVKYAQIGDAGPTLVDPPMPRYTDDAIDDAAPLISGANKVLKFTTVPYSYYFSALQQAAQRNDRVLFVGYGFTDPHVNNWILEAIQHHGEHAVRAVVVDYRPLEQTSIWGLPTNPSFHEIQSRLNGSSLDLESPLAREFIFAGRFGISGGGYPPRGDVTDRIITFLQED